MDKNRKQFLIIVTSLVVVVVFVLAGYMPLSYRLKSIATIKQEAKVQAENAKDEVAKLESLKDELQELKARVGDIEKKVPHDRDFAAFWQEITEIMNACSLEDSLVQPGVEIESDDVCCIPIKIKTVGDTVSIFDFFRKIEEINREVRIERVELSNGNNSEGKIELNADAKIYYRKVNDNKTVVSG